MLQDNEWESLTSQAWTESQPSRLGVSMHLARKGVCRVIVRPSLHQRWYDRAKNPHNKYLSLVIANS